MTATTATTATTAAAITTTATTIVEGYFAMWNEADPAQRHAVIAATWTDNAHYVDPLFAAEGYDALDAMVVAVHTQFPAHRFRLVGAVDAHHERARWDWELVGPDGAPVASGTDFAVLAPDGRLRDVTGFFAPPVSPAHS